MINLTSAEKVCLGDRDLLGQSDHRRGTRLLPLASAG
jgi:hypothetical protein